MKHLSKLVLLALIISWANTAWAGNTKLSTTELTAGESITVDGAIEPGKELFVVVAVLGITLASNLAAGFMTGIVLAYLLKSGKLTV